MNTTKEVYESRENIRNALKKLGTENEALKVIIDEILKASVLEEGEMLNRLIKKAVALKEKEA